MELKHMHKTYAPLAIKWEGGSVNFVLEPTTKIEIQGEKPDLNEFIRAFRYTVLPMVAIEAIYVAVVAAFEGRNDKPQER